MTPVSTNIKIDPNVKKEAQELFERMGLSLSAAVNVFLRQSILEQAIPFRVSAEPSGREATRQAMGEVRLMKEDPSIGKTYSDVDEMMEELLGDGV